MERINMPAKRNLRIVISCVSFETVKVVKPIEYFKADKAYLLCLLEKEIYRQFVREVELQLNELNIESECISTKIYDFAPVLKELIQLIRKEKDEGNLVYVNVAAGPNSYAAAAMVACMMEKATPFFVGTKDFTLKPKAFFVKGKPVGLSKEVKPPSELTTFHMISPNEKVAKALGIWKVRKDVGKVTTDTAIIGDLEKEGLMKNVYEKAATGKKKVSQKAKMQYRRGFLDKWLGEKWVEPVGRGKYEITEDGRVVVEVFG